MASSQAPKAKARALPREKVVARVSARGIPAAESHRAAAAELASIRFAPARSHIASGTQGRPVRAKPGPGDPPPSRAVVLVAAVSILYSRLRPDHRNLQSEGLRGNFG